MSEYLGSGTAPYPERFEKSTKWRVTMEFTWETEEPISHDELTVLLMPDRVGVEGPPWALLHDVDVKKETGGVVHYHLSIPDEEGTWEQGGLPR